MAAIESAVELLEVAIKGSAPALSSNSLDDVLVAPAIMSAVRVLYEYCKTVVGRRLQILLTSTSTSISSDPIV